MAVCIGCGLESGTDGKLQVNLCENGGIECVDDGDGGGCLRLTPPTPGTPAADVKVTTYTAGNPSGQGATLTTEGARLGQQCRTITNPSATRSMRVTAIAENWRGRSGIAVPDGVGGNFFARIFGLVDLTINGVLVRNGVRVFEQSSDKLNSPTGTFIRPTAHGGSFTDVFLLGPGQSATLCTYVTASTDANVPARTNVSHASGAITLYGVLV